jgi:hypothetical protein
VVTALQDTHLEAETHSTEIEHNRRWLDLFTNDGLSALVSTWNCLDETVAPFDLVISWVAMVLIEQAKALDAVTTNIFKLHSLETAA